MEPDVGRMMRTNRGNVEFVPDPEGPLKVYAYPGDRSVCQYAVGGDPTVGMRGDYACAQVLNMRTWEQVATWRGRIDPLRFGDELVLLGEWYNDALLAPEANKSGAAVIARIQTVGYPNLFRHYKSNNVKGQMAQTWGFLSNMQTKPAAIANLLSAIVNIHQGTGRPYMTLHDAKTFNEMRNYIHMDGDRFGNASDEEHDDTVMALAIALTAVLETASVTPGFTSLAPTPTPQYAAANRASRHYQLDNRLVPVPRAAPDWLTDPGGDANDMFTSIEE
jgi:phage terminase large subunit